MKLINLYRKNVYITYKHSLCSFPAFAVLIVTIFTFTIPFFIVHSINLPIWKQDILVTEQPQVVFPYKYLILAELSGNRVITCSSFDVYNDATETMNSCDSIRFVSNDYNGDSRIDRMRFEVEFELEKNETFDFVSMFFLLESHVMVQCNFKIPSAIIIQRAVLPKHFKSGSYEFNGILGVHQKTAFHCPYFMRNSETNFQHNFYPNMGKNVTNLQDFEVKTIQNYLKQNPGYFQYKNEDNNWNAQSTRMNHIQLSLNVNIEEVALRYRSTFWQKLNMMWTQYVAVLLVFIYGMEKLTCFMFRRQFLCAWEDIPWKKNY